LLLSVAAVIFVLDLVSKLLVVANLSDRLTPVTLIPDVLDLQLTRNAGAAFGFAAGATVIFTVVAAAVVVFIVRTARKLASVGWAWALGLLLGGAVGNLGDRLFRAPGPLRGHVVDWIHLHHWPVFNVADSAIVIGGLLAVFLSMRGIGLDGRRFAGPARSAVTDADADPDAHADADPGAKTGGVEPANEQLTESAGQLADQPADPGAAPAKDPAHK
jgi:signal peptidase II